MINSSAIEIRYKQLIECNNQVVINLVGYVYFERVSNFIINNAITLPEDIWPPFTVGGSGRGYDIGGVVGGFVAGTISDNGELSILASDYSRPKTFNIVFTYFI